MDLINSTNNSAADKAILIAIEAIQKDFPQPILAVYVTGSYANGYAVATSDVDLNFIFSNDLTDSEEELADKIYDSLEKIEPPLDIGFYSLPQMIDNGVVEMKSNFLHVYGKDIHSLVPNPPLDEYIYRGMHAAYQRMELTRKTKPYKWPLDFPNNDQLYKGYEWRTTFLEGKEVPSIKEIVVSTGWMATALTEYKGRLYVPNKSECPKLFTQVVGGAHAESFQKITDLCRTKLKYLIPESVSDKEELLALLPRVLALENYFLEQYRLFLIENLNSKNPKYIETSVTRLKEIAFPAIT